MWMQIDANNVLKTEMMFERPPAITAEPDEFGFNCIFVNIGNTK